MATEEPKVETNQSPVIENHREWHHHNRLPIIIGAVLLAFVVFGLGAVAGRIGNRIANFRQGAPAIARDGGGRGARMRTEFGGKFRSDNSQVLRGVVTSASDTELKIAGNGATNTITLNDKTEYQNGSKAAVNDTVIVEGTTNNGTFTATRIVVNP
jgi:hypothetical protein